MEAAEKRYIAHLVKHITPLTLTDRYFHGCMTMEMVVVHPAYWSRGHGVNLVKWGMNLSATDQVCQGVIAATTATALYRKLGYEHFDDVEISSFMAVSHTSTVSVAVMMYTPDSVPRKEL